MPRSSYAPLWQHVWKDMLVGKICSSERYDPLDYMYGKTCQTYISNKLKSRVWNKRVQKIIIPTSIPKNLFLMAKKRTQYTSAKKVQILDWYHANGQVKRQTERTFWFVFARNPQRLACQWDPNSECEQKICISESCARRKVMRCRKDMPALWRHDWKDMLVGKIFPVGKSCPPFDNMSRKICHAYLSDH